MSVKHKARIGGNGNLQPTREAFPTRPTGSMMPGIADPLAQRAIGRWAGAKGRWEKLSRGEAEIAATEHGDCQAVHDLLGLYV
jgi:hypothetical protein